MWVGEEVLELELGLIKVVGCKGLDIEGYFRLYKRTRNI